MLNSVHSAYRAQPIENTYALRKQEPENQENNNSGDSVNISSSAREMMQIDSFFSQLNIPFTPGKPVTMEDLQIGFEETSRKLKDDVNILFLQNDIKNDPPVELTTDSEGFVRVKGDHPQKEKIEKLFENTPDLANDFRGASSLNSLIKAGEEYLEFAKAYDKNPQEAIARFGLLSEKNYDFSMVFGETDQQNTEV